MDVYFKRKTSCSTVDAYPYMMVISSDTDNQMHEDFDIYSTLEDALNDKNPWSFCNYTGYAIGIGFSRDCGPNGSVGFQWNSFSHSMTGQNILYIVILEDTPTTSVSKDLSTGKKMSFTEVVKGILQLEAEI